MYKYDIHGCILNNVRYYCILYIYYFDAIELYNKKNVIFSKK